ncbi:MAG TPA: helix-turn-helix domain-containing protein [Candidatus Binatus sp.]|nr:helix-turn-helix domain-containing protein [Candidatus Binatus sp.]
MNASARPRVNRAATPARARGTLDQVLIDAAMELFASYGYRGTSLSRIARAAGVTKGALYWHFADKEEFFLAVVERVLNDWNRSVGVPKSSNDVEYRAEFLEMFEKNGELNEKFPWVTRLLLIITLESHKIGPRVLRAMRKAQGRQREFLRRVVERGKAIGVFDPSLDADWAAIQIWTSSIGLAQLWYLHGPKFELRASMRRQARELLREWSAAQP